VVQHFLNDVQRHGTYTGFVTLGITWAPLENKHLRDFVGIDTCDIGDLDRSGVMVCKVDPTRHWSLSIYRHTDTHTQTLSLSLSLSLTHTCVCVCVCVCVYMVCKVDPTRPWSLYIHINVCVCVCVCVCV
jgi:hypothetical protein